MQMQYVRFFIIVCLAAFSSIEGAKLYGNEMQKKQVNDDKEDSAFASVFSNTVMSGNQALTFDVINEISNVDFHTNGSKLIIKKAGTYFLSFDVITSGTGPHRLGININGMPMPNQLVVQQSNTSYPQTIVGTFLKNLKKGDAVELQFAAPTPPIVNERTLLLVKVD